MKQIRWTPAAARELEAFVRHIRQDNIEAARRVAIQIVESLERLRTFPNLGRVGQKPGTRELVLPPLVIVYRVADEFVEPIRIWHGAQERRGR